MKPYPEYKVAGHARAKNIPAHWSVVPCRTIVLERREKNTDLKSTNYLSLMANVGVIPYEDKGDVGNKKPEDLTKCKIVHVGDFVINSMNYAIGSYGVSSYAGICSPVYVILRPIETRVHPAFAARIFECKSFQGHAQSFGNGILAHRCAIGWDILKGLPVALPPMDEQAAIACYLDSSLGMMDAAISSQERMIELLKERRSAIITQAVTKGLDPNAKMKDSGVPWLGQVPAHWEVKKVKHLFRHLKVINRGMVCEDRLALTMSGVVPRALDDAEGLQTEDYSNYQIVDRNDLLFKLIDLQNIRTSRVGHVPSRGIVSPAYIRIKSHAAVDVRFSYWYFMSIYVRDIFNTMGAGVRQSLTQSDLLELPFLLPSAAEMSAVAVYLDKVTLEIDSAILSQEQMIELLKERRSAVITQAVTGQIDVR